MDVTVAVFIIVSIIVSGIFHEQWHARVALWLGDPTGRFDKRLSWNPAHHIDLWMTIILPVLLLASSGGRFAFGGMKPVRINPLNFKNPTLGMALSAAAGPLSNFFLALAAFLFLWLVHAVAPDFVYAREGRMLTFNGLFLSIFIYMNLVLGGFNLLPLPGLDGSRILYHFLPRAGQRFMDKIEPYALLITMLLVLQGIGVVLSPMYALFRLAVAEAVGPEFWNAFVIRLRS